MNISFKKSQSFLALFVIFLAIFIYGIYLLESFREVEREEKNYEIEGNLIKNILFLKDKSCIPINYFLEINVFSFYDKGVIELGPFRHNIRNLNPYYISEKWVNEPVSYKFTNSTYYFSYFKKNKVYVQIVFPFNLKPVSKKGNINMICLEGNEVIIK